MNGIRKGRRNGIGNQGALARSRHAGNNRKRTKLDFGSNVFEVVGSSARNFKAAATGLAPFIRHPDHSFAGQIAPVIDSGHAMISAGVPAATTCPPLTPAPGPMSIT